MTTNQSFFQSNTAKIIMVGLLTLVLLIPLQYVKSLISERAHRQEGVINEINNQWGSDIYFCGPILKVPYTTYTETKVTDEKTKKVSISRTVHTKYAYFFPEKLNIDSNVETKPLHRNNYETTVFNSEMNLKGNFIQPDFTDAEIAEKDIQWEKATVVIRTNNNLKSIDGAINIKLNNKEYSFEPVYEENSRSLLTSLETKAIKSIDIAKSITEFNMNISYKGSEELSIAPIGKVTQATVSSNWHTPSFGGNFIPGDKKITDKGFTASWNISQLNRPFTQQSFGVLPTVRKYSFGVKFLIPVDEYQQNERATKYGFLVIGLTFLIFFLIQSFSKINIHIFQYTMIGLALIMFYTLLISITEHSSFQLAYIIAGVSVVVMIGLYSISILKGIKFPLFIAISLSALYTFIYVIIQLENYALLVGSIGLFLILGAVMFVSRKIDWNNTHKINS
ncbi:cell envelope integrity protein CreD [Flavobacterium suaedae]|uniref:Cell envelope integrity protein CreD n=1 Tax=Flavobacterium suaedae TaxID=1767027 RepID=A0ABQ1K129_9FLAO|nr:cell envelope integrity protein CreD [Flavobacterium suaedae]GGB80413.1 cell envelope integrity protein CreD [Flavobacterium suaedae]